jgi:type IV secretion system protein VirD4
MHGASHWESPDVIKNASSIARVDIRSGDCDGRSGLPIISDGNETYLDNSDTHTIIFGSTGSKKTRLFAKPLISSMIMGGESFVATDPKGELYAITSGLAKKHGYDDIIVLNLRDFNQSDRWNPMTLAHRLHHGGDPDRATEVLNDFINVLASEERSRTKDTYFINLASSQILANAMFLMETASEKEFNIYNLMKLCMETGDIAKTEEILSCVAEGSIAAVNYEGVLTNKVAERTYANVVSETAVMLNRFLLKKSLCQLLSQSSFDPAVIASRKTGVYIIVPDEKDTLHFIVSIFLKQVYETLIGEAQRRENLKLPIRVNFVLDEFANIPEIPNMSGMITAGRSRNIRFFLMAQGMRQIEDKYGKSAETIKGNCDNIVFLTSREHALLEDISRLCGTTHNGEALISPSELQRLSKDKNEALILHLRHYPFITQLPDISQYYFETYPPMKAEKISLPNIELYDVNSVIMQIKNGNRVLPFSKEVFGKEKYFSPTKPPISKPFNDIFDW